MYREVWYRVSTSSRWYVYRQQYADNAEGEKVANAVAFAIEVALKQVVSPYAQAEVREVFMIPSVSGHDIAVGADGMALPDLEVGHGRETGETQVEMREVVEEPQFIEIGGKMVQWGAGWPKDQPPSPPPVVVDTEDPYDAVSADEAHAITDSLRGPFGQIKRARPPAVEVGHGETALKLAGYPFAQVEVREAEAAVSGTVTQQTRGRADYPMFGAYAEQPKRAGGGVEPTYQDCPKCGGDGTWPDTLERCPMCQGMGRVATYPAVESEYDGTPNPQASYYPPAPAMASGASATIAQPTTADAPRQTLNTRYCHGCHEVTYTRYHGVAVVCAACGFPK